MNNGPPRQAIYCTIDGIDERFFAVSGSLRYRSLVVFNAAPCGSAARATRYTSLLSDRCEARAVRFELSDGIRVLHRDADIVQPFHQTPPNVVIDLKVRR